MVVIFSSSGVNTAYVFSTKIILSQSEPLVTKTFF